jgi:hypothetical protein
MIAKIGFSLVPNLPHPKNRMVHLPKLLAPSPKLKNARMSLGCGSWNLRDFGRIAASQNKTHQRGAFLRWRVHKILTNFSA